MTRVVVVYGTRAGPGGLGIHAATVIAGLATAAPVVALGPGPALDWPLETPIPTAVNWIKSPPVRRSWLANRVLRRIRPGRLVFQHDRTVGRWAASRTRPYSPRLCVHLHSGRSRVHEMGASPRITAGSRQSQRAHSGVFRGLPARMDQVARPCVSRPSNPCNGRPN